MLQKSVKYFLAFVACVVLSTNAASVTATMHDTASEKIVTFKADITIHATGIFDVRETIKYDFGSVARHGIFRTIPVKYERNGARYNIRISEIKVTDESGNSIPAKASYPGNNLEIKIGDPNTTISGQHTYVINYTVMRAINFFEDHDELFWNVTGNSWPVPIELTTATVAFEGANSEARTTCFVGAVGSTEPCEQMNIESRATYLVKRSLVPGENLTVVYGISKALVVPPTEQDNIRYFILDNGILGIPVIVFVGMFFVWRTFGRDAKGKGIIVPEYDPPQDLTPLEVGVLVDEKVHGRDIAAEIVYLAEQGYFRIEQVEKKKLLIFPSKDYKLVKLKPKDGLKNTFDTNLYSMFFADREEVHLSELKKDKGAFTDLQQAKSAVQDGLVKKGYFIRNPITTKALWLFFGFFLGFIVSWLGLALHQGQIIGIATGVVSGLIVLVFGLFMPARTVAGSIAREQALGLKRYIQVAEKDRLAFHNDPAKLSKSGEEPERTAQRFEKLLPFAMALGVDTAWAKIFEGVHNLEPTWYTGTNGTFSALALTNSLGDFSNSVVAVAAPSSAGGGGSGFSGGGSGGGFGGGGGGSW